MENGKEIEEKRAAAIEELNAAFAELESGEGLARLVGCHGIQSRLFEFEWDEPALEIKFHLPYDRLLSGEESQKSDNEEIGAAIRMAILLLTTVGRISSLSRISVACGDRGTSYAVYSVDGELEDSGEDCGPLVKRLESELSDSTDGLSIILP